jgi:hypothetical protein
LAASSSEDYWASEFLGLDQDQRFVVILTAIGCATAVIITLAGIAYSWIDGANRRRVEAELKREMLDRGMTAEDISKVVESVGLEDATERWLASWCSKKK